MKSPFRQPDPDPAATEAKRRLRMMTGNDRCIRCDGVNGEHEPGCQMGELLKRMVEKRKVVA